MAILSDLKSQQLGIARARLKQRNLKRNPAEGRCQGCRLSAAVVLAGERCE
jgi:hypothetical protein